MFKFNLGIRVHDLDNAPFINAIDIVKELKKHDLNYIQLVYKKAFKDFKEDESFLINSAKIFEENDIKVAMIGAYFNMIHSDVDKKNEGIRFFKYSLDTASIFNSKYAGSETGSHNGDKWTYNELNHTKESYDMVKDVIKELKEHSKNTFAKPIIEGAYNHVIYKPELLNDLTEELGIDSVVFDIFNYLNTFNYLSYKEIFDKGVSLLKNKIKIFHIKDFVVKDGSLVQVAIGDGLIDYNYILNIIKKEFPNSILILEGSTKEMIKKSVDYIRNIEKNLQ